MTPRRLASLLPLAVAASLLPATAHASTIAAEGDTLVYQGTSQRSSLYVRDSYPDGKLRFEDSFTTITSVPDSCELIDDSTADCEVPARIRVVLGPGDDSFGFGDGYTLGLPITVEGGGGSDRLDGDAVTAGTEVLDGGDGNDRIDGFGGADQVLGGAGDDQLEGNGGTDVVLGGDGNDTLAGDDQASPAADVIDGGAGNDLLKDYVEYGTDLHPPADVSLDGVANDGRAGEGDDVRGVERMIAYVSGTFVLTDGAEDWQVWSNMNSGDSTVMAGGGNDRVVGEDGKEAIDGGPGDDYLEGGKNHDTIVGGPGRDTIFGDETDSSCNADYPESCVRYGNDVIDARDGEADQIDCGPGTDRAVVDAADVVAATCEQVERGGAGGTGGRFQAAAGTKLARVLRKGLKLRLTGAAPGVTTVVARHKGKVVARRKVTVGADGTATVTLRLRKAPARRLQRAGGGKLTISGAGVTTALKLRR
jgi:Ca2+-binding RTX toxin-like protein